MILDGWGYAPDPKVSAVDLAKTPFIDQLYKTYPHAQLRTDGLHVGLPDGQMGNSEVGHMNIGAGRIVYQDLEKINRAIRLGTFGEEKVLKEALLYAKENNKKVHLLGLVSDGGVHSHIDHLFALIDETEKYKLKNVFVHAFTDGRDVDPKSGIVHIGNLEKKLATTSAKLVSIVGRYYAMDRDKRWERVQKAYNLLTKAEGKVFETGVQAMESSYLEGVTDEFVLPISIRTADNQPITIGDDDVVIFFNFRTDRGRQLTEVLSQVDLPEFAMKKMPLKYITMTNYDDNFKGIDVIYDKGNIQNTLGEVLANAGKTQIRMAETEKYPHVTFFFSGGREEPFLGEKRILCPSPKVATYDLKPEMSAYDLKDALIPELKAKTTDFVCLNFANGDMVGHTGSLEAAIKACETVDKCVSEIVPVAIENNYTVLIIADHGNCETMKNPDGTPNTAHTTNPVPMIVVDKQHYAVSNGILGDIAPTILYLMNVKQPDEMTGKSLLTKS